MRVLMLNYEFPPLGGGAANANKHILEELTDVEDLKIDLITSSKDRYTEEEFSEDITLYRLDVKKGQIHHWTQSEILRYFFKGLIKSRQLRKEKDYDIIHAWFGFPSGLMALILNQPYVVSLRGSDVPGYNERFSIQYVFLKPIIKRVWKNAESVVANSKGLKELAKKTLDPGIEINTNGVNIEKFQPRDIERDDSDGLDLICVARLTKRKRVSDILKAIQNLEYVNLTLIGEGKEEQNLKELAKDLGIDDQVNFKGYVSHEEIADFYSNSDLFVMPSLNEGMSNTILEAMSSGLPIITTQTGGTAELIKNNGVVVPKKDPEAIKDAIISYREDSEKIKSHSEKSREIAENFTWKQASLEYYEIFQKLT